jgi:hypothetical protein
MCAGVVTEPTEEQELDGNMFMERVAEEKELQWVTYWKTISYHHLINGEDTLS